MHTYTKHTVILLLPVILIALYLYGDIRSTKHVDAAVAINAVTSMNANATSTVSLSHTTAGLNRHLLVTIHHAGDTNHAVTSVTYGGVPLTKITSAAIGSYLQVTEMWHLTAPPIGTNNIVVTTDIPAKYLAVTAISRTGIDQVSPIVSSTGTFGTTGTNPTITVPSQMGNVVQDAISWNKYITPQATATAGPGQTALANLAGTFQLGVATSEEAGSATTTMSWVLSTSRPWSMVAVEIKAALTIDTVYPTSSLLSFIGGEKVKGIVTLTATASDDTGIAGVLFYVDGQPLGAEDLTAPYTVSWDTTLYNDGNHALSTAARDTSGNTSASTPVNVIVDDTPPQQSNGLPSGILPPGTTQTSLSLTTDEDAICRYGTASLPYTSLPQQFTQSVTTIHSTTLTGLQDGNSYTYYVRCEDTAGNQNQTDTIITFSVNTPSDTTGPVIQNVIATNTRTTSTTIQWTTDEPADSYVEYGPTSSYGLSSILEQTLRTSHSLNLSGLSPSTDYHYRVTSKDAAGNISTSTDFTFSSARPNFVILMSDNQTVRSVSEAMVKVQTLLAKNGVSFTNAHVPYPLCCPARATFVTGQFSHNNNVMANDPPAGGYANLDHTKTLPVWLQQAGYYTVHIGKHLNGYGTQDSNPNDSIPPCKEVPVGWNEWYGNVAKDAEFTNYVLNENGSLVKYGNPPSYLPTSCTFSATSTGYQTDVYNQKALKVINQRASATDGKPFFLWVAYGTRAAATPAPRHIGFFSNFAFPIVPSFNEADVSDKPTQVRNKPLFTSSQINNTKTTYKGHLEALLSIDEGVGQVINALSANGQLDDTVVIYLSDQGQLYGEHRASGVAWAYEESVKIPLIIRGPGFAASTTINKLVSGVDFAPTIVDLARATPTRVMDGSSLIPLVKNPSLPWRSYDFHESNVVEGSNTNYYNGVRDSRYVYFEHGPNWTEKELYDLQADPYQLVSKHADPAFSSILQNLKNKLDALKNCSGSSCWQ
jgi:N-acetylglucosamine-6-sulfatase